MIKKLKVSAQPEEQSANKQVMTNKLKSAIASNKSYLAITAPTAAQRNEQVADLTKQVNLLIKLALQDFRDS